MIDFDVIVLGAGAAGLMAAARAGQRGKKVLVLERAEEVGKKIIISGGGHCNFTNREIKADRYISENPHFCKSALASYTQTDFVKLVEKYKIPFHEKTLGQLFCDGSAREIVTMLLTECFAGHIELKCNQRVRAVSKAESFKVETDTAVFSSHALILATGGLSIPKMGATGLSLEIAEKFGLKLVTPKPALVPLTFDPAKYPLMNELAGVALEIVAKNKKTSFQEAMIFTHRGLSGPSILQISSYWQEGTPIVLDLLPGIKAEEILVAQKKARGRAELKTILADLMPQRLAHAFAETYCENTVVGNIPDKKLKEAATLLKNWSVQPNGTEGYAKAEVMMGGIDTKFLSSKTMEANKIPGLYAVGEAVDVTGWLGGYNFQWAWSSGWAAGSAV